MNRGVLESPAVFRLSAIYRNVSLSPSVALKKRDLDGASCDPAGEGHQPHEVSGFALCGWSHFT